MCFYLAAIYHLCKLTPRHWQAIGLSIIWSLGTLNAAFSYVVGSSLAIGYLVLLSQFVAEFESGGGASSGRFALVFLLVLLAGKLLHMRLRNTHSSPPRLL